MTKISLSSAIAQHNPLWDELLQTEIAKKTISRESLKEISKVLTGKVSVIKSAMQFVSKKDFRFLQKNKNHIVKILLPKLSRQELQVILKETQKFMTWQDVLLWSDVFSLIRSGFKDAKPYMLGIRFGDDANDNYPAQTTQVYCEPQSCDAGINMKTCIIPNRLPLGENNQTYVN